MSPALAGGFLLTAPPGILLFILSYVSCLYILQINPLSVALFANIFSYPIGCLFFYG